MDFTIFSVVGSLLILAICEYINIKTQIEKLGYLSFHFYYFKAMQGIIFERTPYNLMNRTSHQSKIAGITKSDRRYCFVYFTFFVVLCLS